jgi:hypothetical protein
LDEVICVGKPQIPPFRFASIGMTRGGEIPRLKCEMCGIRSAERDQAAELLWLLLFESLRITG